MTHWCICGRRVEDHSARCFCCDEYFLNPLCCQDCPCGSYLEAHVTRAATAERCEGSLHGRDGWWRRCRRMTRTRYGNHALCKTHAWQAASLAHEAAERAQNSATQSVAPGAPVVLH